MIDDERIHALLDALARLDVEGPSRGGPYVGIEHNATTRAVVAQGARIVPALRGRLADAGWSEAVYVVFCLRELHAASARDDVAALLQSGRFGDAERDLTLEMQIRYYLRDVDTWPAGEST